MIYRRVIDRVCMACKTGFCWCCVRLLQKNCAKKIRIRKSVIIQQNNEVDHKSNKNAVVGVGKLNIPEVNKAVTVKVKEIEIEVAGFL